VAVYLLLLGVVNWSRRPLLVSGGRDAAALALAVSGMAIVGPIELFFPFHITFGVGCRSSIIFVILHGSSDNLVRKRIRSLRRTNTHHIYCLGASTTTMRFFAFVYFFGYLNLPRRFCLCSLGG
jgi:hypothetical protein